MSGSAIALLSGGLDSGVSLAMWLARSECRVSRCLTFDYGQRSAGAECAAAQRLAQRFDVPWRCIELPWLAEVARRGGSVLHGGELPAGSEAEPGDQDSAAAVWVPARNVVFLSIAASFAESQADAVVICGFNREEAATFADNSAAFVEAMDAVLQFGTRNGVRVCSPTLHFDKFAIVAKAREHGLAATDFWSCYDGGAQACGRCESCLRSTRAWRHT